MVADFASSIAALISRWEGSTLLTVREIVAGPVPASWSVAYRDPRAPASSRRVPGKPSGPETRYVFGAGSAPVSDLISDLRSALSEASSRDLYAVRLSGGDLLLWWVGPDDRAYNARAKCA